VLRCYLLRLDERPCAYAIGFQSNGIFHFHETAYNPLYSRYSPGKSLLHLILKDCFERDKPNLFYFGPGAEAYKKLFSNREGTEINLLILRNTLRNCAFVMSHRYFRIAAEGVKRIHSRLRRV
jgi:CelD/BcsL family acetyltransferase involved in cellulose biosynthesis